MPIFKVVKVTMIVRNLAKIYSSANGLHDQLLYFKVLHIQKLLGKNPNQNQTQECRVPTDGCFQKPGLVVQSIGPFQKGPSPRTLPDMKLDPLIQRCQQPRFATPCSGLFSLCAGLCLNAPLE